MIISNDWSIEKSSELYGIEYWGNEYYRINSKGNIAITPQGNDGPSVDLLELTEDLLERGLRVPILMRFPDIIRSRVELLTNCFANAIKENKYEGEYCLVYPIKVNQQRNLVKELIRFGQFNRLGLECGSKPELLVALALMTTPNALIVCNGFKDEEYIETAILSQKLGRNTIIVVDRFVELGMIINAAKRFNVTPKIGFRAKLTTPGSGRWVESSGAKSKFGLTPYEMVESIRLLKSENMLHALELLHYHIGSQVPSIQSIKSSLKEAGRFFTELYAMGARPSYIDVGGGLGVDYDGSRKSDNSTNYTEQEYANDVVSILHGICNEKKVPHPHIITESGRSLVAHGSILVYNILGVNELYSRQQPNPIKEGEHQILQDLQYMYNTLNKNNVNEYYNDLTGLKQEILQLFTYGVLSLEDRAKAESLCWVIASRIHELAKSVEDTEDMIENLENELSATYFCNFSVFQSLPDAWAINQRFPIMPIHRLEERPTRHAILVDLTCDSDGKIEKFIDTEYGEYKKTIHVHKTVPDKPYYLAVFITGAYQEILGDLHNLFGDTDAVHITISKNGYSIDSVIQGDTVEEVLGQLQYFPEELIEQIRQASEESILRGSITKQEAKLLMKNYQEGLSGYTYLEDPE